ncbi:hypothetical protein RDMS_00520 [Deinococcus sp. RL]|uniref:hypothetical protein n=1 Tax=Deinococcus sp. RL TaxID=1489678 RepID=UPI0004D88E28|nr:hypothetical protein [Deinococcus sp. RL]KEF35702.1 hypothetical protein RDMS_00520 [Deinococcus sp. RL]
MPEFDAVQDAQTFSAALPSARQLRVRLEDLPLAFAAFQSFPQPHGEGLEEALAVLSFAGSGLAVFMVADGEDEAWGTAARARLWAEGHLSAARLALPDLGAVDVGRLTASPLTILPGLRSYGEEMVRECARFAAWYTVGHLIERAHLMEDGEAEDLLAALLSDLAEHDASGPAFVPPISHLN